MSNLVGENERPATALNLARINSLISTLARNAPIQDVSLTLAALNCIIRCKCTLANHYLQHA